MDLIIRVNQQWRILISIVVSIQIGLTNHQVIYVARAIFFFESSF
jgi:hypothetical protein